MPAILADIPAALIAAVAVTVTAAAALLLHWVALIVLRGAAARTATRIDDDLVRRLANPSRWFMVALALLAIAPSLPLGPTGQLIWRRAAGVVVPGLVGWLAIAVLSVVTNVVLASADISVGDNLRARRRQTRATILRRVAASVILLATFCAMLISFPAVRSIGVTLAASAGLAGLAVGAAAQPALKNLIAGIQMAFTEPIRIDDVVVIDGEWGRIEEIRLSYVVVKIWDERRLVVPVSKFLESSFQNWTRKDSQLLGTAFLQVDPTADVGRIRSKLEEVVRSDPKWDKRVVGLQVTDTHPDYAELRCLVSGANAGDTFDLRCNVREAMLAFLREEMPEALARQRLQILESGRA